MAKITYAYPIETVRGRFNKSSHTGPVQRRKTYRDSSGNIIGYGSNESYWIDNPRDYDRDPLTGKQLESVNCFRRAVIRANEERHNPERMKYWTERWEKQLKTPEDFAPVDEQTGKRHSYMRLDKFIIAALIHEPTV